MKKTEMNMTQGLTQTQFHIGKKKFGRNFSYVCQNLTYPSTIFLNLALLTVEIAVINIFSIFVP